MIILSLHSIQLCGHYIWRKDFRFHGLFGVYEILIERNGLTSCYRSFPYTTPMNCKDKWIVKLSLILASIRKLIIIVFIPYDMDVYRLGARGKQTRCTHVNRMTE